MLRSRAPLAVAAAIMLAVALGLLSVLGSFGGRAEAAPVNFAVILDALPLGPQEAFRKFLTLYQAEPSTPEQLRRFAPALDFNVPETLPGGFRRTAAYALDFGGRPGVAAAYLRDGEFLATIFHAPVRKEDFGTHKDYPCVVGQHRGQKVEVGEWQLVHLTDPTTCHCVLSRMDEDSQLPEVFAAIAPGSSTRNR